MNLGKEEIVLRSNQSNIFDTRQITLLEDIIILACSELIAEVKIEGELYGRYNRNTWANSVE